jgi:hypothetical protein
MLRTFTAIIGMWLTVSCAIFRTPADDAAKAHSEPEEETSLRQRERAWIQGDAYPAQKSIAEYRADPAWKTRVAFLYPNTGNRIDPTAQPSQSHFRNRRSRFTEVGKMTYAEILVSGRSADLEVVLKDKGLTATFLAAVPENPGEQNTIVEVCTYLDEKPQELEMGPLDMKMETVYYVRTLKPDAVTRISTGPVQIKKTVGKATFSSWDMERNLGPLLNARGAAQAKLLDWLVDHLKD